MKKTLLLTALIFHLITTCLCSNNIFHTDDLKQIKKLVKEGPEIISISDLNKVTPLHVAVKLYLPISEK